MLSSKCEVINDYDGKVYLIEPVEPSGCLLDLISQKKVLDEAEPQHLFRQVIAIFAFCHHLWIIIRSTRLQRFVFTDEDPTKQTKLRIADPLSFYVCKDINDDTIMFEGKYNDEFTSPEVASIEKKPFQERAEIFGLLVYFYM